MSIWKRIIRAFEKTGQSRANAELRRMGYTPEYLQELTNKNLDRWV